MHEIITLQLGHRSNYLATHFWNLQESYFTYSAEEESPVDHDVHFRAGIGADGSDTYTPRTVIYDLKGGFGALRKYNALYDVEEEPGVPRGLWDGNEVVQQQPAVSQNEYQRNLDLGLRPPQLTADAVRYWSDFNRVFYHPRSIVQLSEYELNSQVMPFADWFVGEDLFKSLDRDNDVLDRDFRPFAEECDQLQGIQIFSGIDDSWGGFAAQYVDRLRDEFGKKSIWLFGLEDGAMSQRHKQAIAIANSARSMNDISPQTTAYIPIRDPPRHLPTYVSSELSSEWLSSALVSTAVESITLPTRLRSYRGAQSWLPEEDSSRKIFSLNSAVVSDERHQSETFPEPDKEELVTEDEERDDKRLLEGFDLDFFGGNLASTATKKIHVFGQTQVSRGLNDNNDKSPRPISALQKFHSSLKFPVLDCFPQDLFTHEGAPGSTLRICTALSTTSQVGDRIKELQKFAARAVSLDERETLYNGLGELSEAYQEWWESGTDSEDD